MTQAQLRTATEERVETTGGLTLFRSFVASGRQPAGSGRDRAGLQLPQRLLRLKKEFPTMTLPVLILHGTADQATKPSGSKHFYEKVGSQDKTLKLYDGHFHDLLNDLDKEVVMADITNWIVRHLPS